MKMVDAAAEALKALGGGPATTSQIHDEIVRRKLYEFKAQSPTSVLSSAMRKATEGSASLRGKATFISPRPGSFQLAR